MYIWLECGHSVFGGDARLFHISTLRLKQNIAEIVVNDAFRWSLSCPAVQFKV